MSRRPTSTRIVSATGTGAGCFPALQRVFLTETPAHRRLRAMTRTSAAPGGKPGVDQLADRRFAAMARVLEIGQADGARGTHSASSIGAWQVLEPRALRRGCQRVQSSEPIVAQMLLRLDAGTVANNRVRSASRRDQPWSTNTSRTSAKSFCRSSSTMPSLVFPIGNRRHIDAHERLDPLGSHRDRCVRPTRTTAPGRVERSNSTGAPASGLHVDERVHDGRRGRSGRDRTAGARARG